MIDGNLGSKLITNTGLLESLDLTTFLRASCLGILLAFSIALFTHPGLYSLDNKSFLSSAKRFSLSSGWVQILTILSAREKGMLSVTCAGWHELVSKYWFLSVSFLYRSVTIFPSSSLQSVSKNAREWETSLFLRLQEIVISARYLPTL